MAYKVIKEDIETINLVLNKLRDCVEINEKQMLIFP